MHVGLHIVTFSWPNAPASIAPTLAKLVETADEIGVTHLSVMDHWFQMEMVGSAAMEMLESYSTLAFIAAHTRRARIGALVTGVSYRHPGLLAKIVTTLDVLSGGRAELGIGAAWYEREHLGLGVPFPPVRERFERLEETLRICLQMWSNDDGPFHGKHYQLAETLCVPQPIQRPHPPILIGGGGEKKTLRLVARYADACNLFSRLGHDGLAHKLDVLRRHCDDEKRDYSAIRRTLLHVGPVPDASDASMKELAAYSALGFETIIFVPFGPDPVGVVRKLEPLIPRLAELGP